MRIETKEAFRGWSFWKLVLCFFKFWVIGNKLTQRFGVPFTKFAIQRKLPIRWLFKPFLFDTFCGGENEAELQKRIAKLKQKGFGIILDYAVEGEKDEDSFEQAKQKIIETLGFQDCGFAVVKASAIASRQALELKQEPDFERFVNRLNEIANACVRKKLPLMIDAEETWLQETISAVAKSLMLKHNQERVFIFNTYQMYLKSKLQELQNDLAWANEMRIFLGVKLVRGAYLSKERENAERLNMDSPVHESKEDTDKAFDDAVEICFQANQVELVLASHNEKSCEKAAMMRNDKLTFAHLEGMGLVLGSHLLSLGLKVYKYLPFGPFEKTIPYLLRRAEENQSLNGELNRELYYAVSEMKSRLKKTDFVYFLKNLTKLPEK